MEQQQAQQLEQQLRQNWQQIRIDDVETAFEKMHRGDVLRSVVVL